MSSESVEHTHIIEYHPKPESLRQKVKDIQSKFSRKLYQIENDYVNAKMNPYVSSYENTYDRRLRGVHGIQTELFEENTEITKNQNEIGKRLEQYVQVINNEKVIEEDYKKKIEAVERLGTGSAGLRKNMTDSYKLQYASNFFLILGLIMGSIMIYIVFAKKIISGEVSIQPSIM